MATVAPLATSLHADVCRTTKELPSSCCICTAQSLRDGPIAHWGLRCCMPAVAKSNTYRTFLPMCPSLHRCHCGIAGCQLSTPERWHMVTYLHSAAWYYNGSSCLDPVEKVLFYGVVVEWAIDVYWPNTGEVDTCSRSSTVLRILQHLSKSLGCRNHE